MNKLIPFLSLIAFTVVVWTGCCDPTPRNSLPLVLDSTYSDTAIKDIPDRFVVPIPDSEYYPIYSIDIKNIGTESDTFTLTYKRVRHGLMLPLEVKQYVPAGEIRTFRTIGPLPDHPVDSQSFFYYLSFFVQTTDTIPIQKMNPEVTISYGKTDNGDESCSSPGETQKVDISNWK